MRHRKIDADRILERLLNRGYGKLIRCPVMKTRGGKRCCHYHIPTCYLAEAMAKNEKILGRWLLEKESER